MIFLGFFGLILSIDDIVLNGSNDNYIYKWF